jgi:hypothetical protein
MFKRRETMQGFSFPLRCAGAFKDHVAFGKKKGQKFLHTPGQFSPVSFMIQRINSGQEQVIDGR